MDPLSPGINFRSSRTKLLPLAITLAVFAIPIGFASALIFMSHLTDDARFEIGDLIVAVLVHSTTAFLFWSVIQTIRRILSPDTVHLDADGLRVTRLGRVTFYLWQELGQPEIILRSSNSVARAIRLPLASREHRPLIIEAEQFTHSIEDIVQAFKQARLGNLDYAPQMVSLAAYRYFAIPMTVVIAGIVIATAVALSNV